MIIVAQRLSNFFNQPSGGQRQGQTVFRSCCWLYNMRLEKKQNASEYGPTFLGIIKTLILVYVNLPSSISSIFYSLCHTQCDLFDSVVRGPREKGLCVLMSLNMPLEPGKRRGRGGGGKKRKIFMIYTQRRICFSFWPTPFPPHLP